MPKEPFYLVRIDPDAFFAPSQYFAGWKFGGGMPSSPSIVGGWGMARKYPDRKSAERSAKTLRRFYKRIKMGATVEVVRFPTDVAPF